MSPASSPSSTILVTGATGYVGGRLVPCLLREGYRVRCLVRDATRLQTRPWSDAVEVTVGDALSPETLPPAMKDVEVVYYLIHSLGAGEGTFVDRDRQAAINVREAAAEAGVDRFIYLGGMRPKGTQQSQHLQSRIETGRVLRDGRIPVTEFRAAQIVGSGSLSFEIVRYLTERVPFLICPRWVHTPTQPIAIHDVLEYLVAALEQPDSRGEIIEIGGADVLTYADMFQIYAAVRDLRRWVVNVPVLTPRLSSHWIEFVTPISNTVARPLIKGLDNEVTVDDPAQARSLFPEIDPLPFEAAVRLALRRPASDMMPTVWNRPVSTEVDTSTAQFDLTEGLYREERTVRIDAPPSAVFDTIQRLGGDTGWLYGDLLWRLRGWIDLLIGGTGFRQGRRDPETLYEGDEVDFWRVEALNQDRLLRLRAQMKLPGRAWLQFKIHPVSDSPPTCHLRQTVFFEPKGLAGLLYWLTIQPFHGFLFSGMLAAVKEKTESQAHSSPLPSPVDVQW